MKTIRLCLLSCLVALAVACTPLHRGFEGATLVSPARPDVALVAEGLPILAQGRLTPFLQTDNGYQFPETYLAVYGKDSRSPLAIVMLALVPSNIWEWDPLSFSGPLAVQTAGAAFGGRSFYGNIRIVNGAQDPFSPLVAQEDQWASVNWLAQRFAVLEDFNKAKIILEYREPLPASLEGAASVPLYNEDVQAFQARAAKAFSARFGGKLPAAAAAPYLDTLNTKYLGQFVGSMAVKDYLFLDLDS